MLENEGIYNDISPKLREKLENRVNSFGKRVRYKFNLGRENPDPQKYNGAIIYPGMYNLDPIQFKITDADEDRPNKQKVKNIGIIKSMERDDRGNNIYRFTRIQVTAGAKGLLEFDMAIEESRTAVALLELHPKNGSGLFPNPQMIPIITRIDEGLLATQQRSERSARKKALDAAEAMSDKEIIEFADAMNWDTTDDVNLIKNKVEQYAEQYSDEFNQLYSSEKMKVQALIKKGIDTRILSYNPSEGSLSWVSNSQQIISLGQGQGIKTDVERFSDWILESGAKGDAAHKKLKTLSEKPTTANVV